jgi:hypothetical protein
MGFCGLDFEGCPEMSGLAGIPGAAGNSGRRKIEDDLRGALFEAAGGFKWEPPLWLLTPDPSWGAPAPQTSCRGVAAPQASCFFAGGSAPPTHQRRARTTLKEFLNLLGCQSLMLMSTAWGGYKWGYKGLTSGYK